MSSTCIEYRLANTASVLPATWMELKRITLKIKYVMLKKFATQHSIKFIVLLSFFVIIPFSPLPAQDELMMEETGQMFNEEPVASLSPDSVLRAEFKAELHILLSVTFVYSFMRCISVL